jgi:hypothetical protein
MRDQFVAEKLMFAQRGYCSVAQLIAQPQLIDLRKHHRELVINGLMKLGDVQSRRRWVTHNEQVSRAVHDQLAPVMTAIAGVPVKPSYTYTIRYEAGAELPRHVDRAQCEYSISICIDFEPEPDGPTPWPLWLETRDGHVSIYQALGDGLFYRGRQLPHYRSRLPQKCRSTSMLLHYVNVEFTGPLN